MHDLNALGILDTAALRDDLPLAQAAANAGLLLAYGGDQVAKAEALDMLAIALERGVGASHGKH